MCQQNIKKRINTATNYNKHIIVVGSARSGTSWLSETMAQQFRYRMLFEPEHPKNTKKGHLLADHWIKSDNGNREAVSYLKNIIANKVDCNWIAQNSNRKYKMHLWPLIPKKYIIKFVRCNLSAKYFNETFQVPLVHIIRNPYDVLHSQQRVKFPWLYDLSVFQKQEDLKELLLNKFKLDISQIENYSELEILTLRWCIENVIPLEIMEPYKGKSRVVKHENLRGEINEYFNLCEYFNITPVKDIQVKYKKASSKTHPKSNIRNNQNIESKFSTEEYFQINTILDIFQTKLYPRKSQ